MFTASDVVYPIIDPTSSAEAARLYSQHTALHTCLELLPSLPPDTVSPRLLDLACGAGGWLLDAAYELSEAHVIGIDPNLINIQYVHALARVSLRHNISCQTMDLRSELPFPHSSFDLITGCFLSTWLGFEEWLPMLTQCRSFLRPDGVLRLIEAEAGHCSSPACEQLSTWYEQALLQSGAHSGQPNWCDLLKKAGYHITEQRAVLDFSAGSLAQSPMHNVIESFFLLVQPFVTKCGVVAEEVFRQTYEQMRWEMSREDFSGSWHLIDLQATLYQQ